MAASIYATPPPDLSSEDTALSDVSNNSATTNNATAAVSASKQLTSVTTTPTTNTNTTNNSCEEALFKSATATATTSSSSLSATTTTATTAIKSPLSNNNNNNNSQQQKRTISSDALRDTSSKLNDTIAIFNPTIQCSSNLPNMGSSTNADRSNNENYDNEDNNQQQLQLQQHQQQNTTATTMAAVAAAANAAMQFQLLEAINDAAKKRRKQNNPSKMDEEIITTKLTNSSVRTVDLEDKLSKMFLPKSMEQLKETFELLQQQQQQQQQQQNIENISKTQEVDDNNKVAKFSSSDMEEQQQQQHHQQQAFNNPYHTFCKECGENFENEFKLSLHMLQEHNENSESFSISQRTGRADLTPLDILSSVKVKMERPECDSPTSNHNLEQSSSTHDHSRQENHSSSSVMLTNGKEQQQWMGAAGMSTMGFPFPPEAAAAAALQAGGYLPLLGVPGFPGVDGLNRPPLRIFNPEAFCELCNKEFCNKYFLKTHKANKHGIYDPTCDGLSSTQQQQQTNLNAMNQIFQLQMQQQQQHLQQQQHHMQMELAQQKLLSEQQRKESENSTSNLASTSSVSGRATHSSSNNNSQAQVSPPAPAPVFCDICSKRFTNVFAMRRHRAKAHEQNCNSNSQRNSPSEPTSNSIASALTSSQSQEIPAGKQFQMPEGFRQDFVLEQEEVSFTPQPRKLSPQLQQQARDANFNYEKLKRLGVMNPEAFCEICCKEYCNKYFLRTHKWKRHGVFMPPEEMENPQKLATWPFVNMAGMPVNLMMAQRMMTGSQNDTDDVTQQPSKRIKLEQPDQDEVIKDIGSDENQENHSENNRVLSVPSTPEPRKQINDSQSMVQSPEAAVGLQNLQKLQTMIQQLNDLNGGKRPIACHLCGRETENQYELQAHLMAEHNGGIEGGFSTLNFPSQFLIQQQALLKQSPNTSPSSLIPLMGMAGAGELRCTPCEKEFTNLPEFQKHIGEVHLLTTNSDSPLREGFITPERPINSSLVQSTRPPYTITPTSSYCEICNKELCNKYFMKTHMQRMHGIEIENGAQIGGVVCNICNKELCSKYFLRVHKHNTHGIIEDGAPLPTPRQNGLNLETLQQQLIETEGLNRNLNMSPFGSGGSEGKNDSYSTSPYTEACSICTRRFRNTKWLRNHLLSEHGPAGIEKVRELEQQHGGSLSKPPSPTLKIPNGSSSTCGSGATTAVPSPAQLAQALQNLNAQHLLQNMPKNNVAASFNSEQNLTSPQLKEYQCSLCPFTTPYYAFLFIHERTHSIINNNEREHEEYQTAEDPYKHENQEVLQKEQPRLEDENKSLKRKHKRDLKTPTDIVALDQDDEREDGKERDFEDVAEVKYVENDSPKLQAANEQTKLPIRLASPTEITTTTSHEELQKYCLSKTTLNKNKTINVSKDIRHSSLSPKGFRSTACSPMLSNQLQQLLQEISQQSGKPATYAVPQCEDAAAAQMQAFVIEPVTQNDETDDVSNRFMPAIVYLPVKERLTGTMKLSFNLTPV